MGCSIGSNILRRRVLRALSRGRVEGAFAETKRFRRRFDEFIGVDVTDRASCDSANTYAGSFARPMREYKKTATRQNRVPVSEDG
jgi:hypothetical protein